LIENVNEKWKSVKFLHEFPLKDGLWVEFIACGGKLMQERAYRSIKPYSQQLTSKISSHTEY